MRGASAKPRAIRPDPDRFTGKLALVKQSGLLDHCQTVLLRQNETIASNVTEHGVDYRNGVPSRTAFGAKIMATGPGVNQGKTPFVAEFLSVNPDATLATVNEAWKSAGNEGTVSESLVGKTRSKLKLTGKKGTNGGSSEAITGSAAQSKSPKGTKGRGASKAEEALSPPNGREGGTGSSKSAFVEEMLGRDPKANVKAINRAWTAAGNEGTISDTVVYKTKRELGVTGSRSPGESASAGASKPESPQTMAKPERAASPVEATPSQAQR